MKLELIVEKPALGNHSTPLLFLHGMYQAAWVWQEHFMPFFAKHGYECYAMSLRGHGKSEGRERLNSSTMGDYVSDLDHVVNQIERPPVVIGHSMGGVITQMYLKSRQLPAAVLLAPVPHFGMLPFLLRYLRRHFLSVLKAVVTQRMLYCIDTTDKCRELMFPKNTPDEIVKDYLLRLRNDSFAAFLQMNFLRLTNPRLVKTPLLIIGGTDDSLFPIREIKATARAYGTNAIFIPNMTHNPPCDPEWQNAANHILNWLSEQDL
jgi:pimeloyl-ACP methyl ester carboxylesterase